MAAECAIGQCGVVAVGRCGACHRAFCASHQAQITETIRTTAHDPRTFSAIVSETKVTRPDPHTCSVCGMERQISADRSAADASAAKAAHHAASSEVRESADAVMIIPRVRDLIQLFAQANVPTIQQFGPETTNRSGNDECYIVGSRTRRVGVRDGITKATVTIGLTTNTDLIAWNGGGRTSLSQAGGSDWPSVRETCVALEFLARAAGVAIPDRPLLSSDLDELEASLQTPLELSKSESPRRIDHIVKRLLDSGVQPAVERSSRQRIVEVPGRFGRSRQETRSLRFATGYFPAGKYKVVLFDIEEDALATAMTRLDPGTWRVSPDSDSDRRYAADGLAALARAEGVTIEPWAEVRRGAPTTPTPNRFGLTDPAGALLEEARRLSAWRANRS